MDKLFNRIAALMTHRQLYTNPAIARKDIADILQSNEAYIHRAIKQRTGLTFTAYVSALRLEHACKQLAANDHSTIEAIAAEAGYRSRKTFHLHFRQRYGCTPDEYRRQHREEIEISEQY